MPLPLPPQDNRTYQQLRSEALARIPVHTPEWTNFNASDPGVTLIEVFAFLAENLLYRSNLIPDRNRLKFLNLLGVPLSPGATARGLVTIVNERGPKQVFTLHDDIEVRAGAVPFRTEMGLDVLPIEAQVFYKRELTTPDPTVKAYYRQLYASYLGGQQVNVDDARLYETVPFPPFSANSTGVNLGNTLDRSLWVALLLRPADKPADDKQKSEVRAAIANRVLSLGVLPLPPDQHSRHLTPVGQAQPGSGARLIYQIPDLPPGGILPRNRTERIPRYKPLETVASDDVLAGPGIVQIRLPAKAEELDLWKNLDPLEAGVGEFPPSLEDTALNDRLITWLRITAPASAPTQFLWLGINATPVTQRTRIAHEPLPPGTGRPDQVVQLAQPPVIPDSVTLTVIDIDGNVAETWQPIDDLFAAGSEVPVADPQIPAGTPATSAPAKVYTLDPASGELRFGDGVHGARPPFNATLRADYDRSAGAAGNVAVNAISASPNLPPGLRVSNPVPTWGGMEPEDVRAGEKRVTSYLQHRNRLVTAEDFREVAYRTPGVDVGRVEVLPAYNPDLLGSQPGDAPGAVTLMVIPRDDPAHPNAPLPSSAFLDAMCQYLDPLRLVTTEIFLRPPTYRAVWAAIGISIVPRASVAQVTEAVKLAVQDFLSPLPSPDYDPLDEPPTLFLPPAPPTAGAGWPLRKSVQCLELWAVANRVSGVALVIDVALYDEKGAPQDRIDMSGLDLPTLAGLAVGIGAVPPASSIPGFPSSASGTSATTSTGDGQPAFVSVPVIPEECR